jgi:hypothetical protein
MLDSVDLSNTFNWPDTIATILLIAALAYFAVHVPYTPIKKQGPTDNE